MAKREQARVANFQTAQVASLSRAYATARGSMFRQRELAAKIKAELESLGYDEFGVSQKLRADLKTGRASARKGKN